MASAAQLPAVLRRAVPGDEGSLRGSLLLGSLAQPSHHPQSPESPRLLEVGPSSDVHLGGARGRGCPGMPRRHGWLSGDGSNSSPGHGSSPATQHPSSSPRCLLRQPRPGSWRCSLRAHRGSEQGWVPCSEAAVSLSGVFLPVVCVIFSLCLGGSETGSNDGGNSTSRSLLPPTRGVTVSAAGRKILVVPFVPTWHLPSGKKISGLLIEGLASYSKFKML